MGNTWTKKNGRAIFKKLFPPGRQDFPARTIIELTPRELQMLLSAINVQLYKLDKEDKPFLPTENKKNANHVRQDLLLSVASKIASTVSSTKENITK